MHEKEKNPKAAVRLLACIEKKGNVHTGDMLRAQQVVLDNTQLAGTHRQRRPQEEVRQEKAGKTTPDEPRPAQRAARRP